MDVDPGDRHQDQRQHDYRDNREIGSRTVEFHSAREGCKRIAERPEDFVVGRHGRSRIEWNTYGGHWQMAVWNEDYCTRWGDNVVAELAGSLWDGVMADNDIYDDYYGLCPPIDGGRTLADFRSAVDEFVALVGASLNAVDKQRLGGREPERASAPAGDLPCAGWVAGRTRSARTV